MLGRLFPRSLSNAYQGSRWAIVLLLPVLLMKTLIGFNFSGVNPYVDVREILKTVDGVPLDTFSPQAVASVLDASGAWGAALFALCLLAWIILIRFRAGLPLAIMALLVEQLLRTGADTLAVVQRIAAGTAQLAPGAMINLGMSALLVSAFVFSLLAVRPQAQATPLG
jgi:hypothetical protein